MRSSPVGAACTLAGLVLVGGCGGGDGDATSATTESTAVAAADATTTSPETPEPRVDPGDGGSYAPEIDPAGFVDTIDNPYLPLIVGSRWVYEGESDGEVERIEVTVTGDRKVVMGIDAFVVRDTVSISGELVEDTYDWFAQDADGNVWYLGEASNDYENGELVSTAGSWEAGVDGALPGIVMPAVPAIGDAYRQEFYAGEAEDMMEIIDVDASLDTDLGSYEHVVVTEDWTPLEPDVFEQKYYAPGVGNIREENPDNGSFADLIVFTPGS